MNTTYRRSLLWCILGLLCASHLMAPSATFQANANAAPESADTTNTEKTGNADKTGNTPDADSTDAPPMREGTQPVAGGGPVVIIPIEGMIYEFTFESIKRRVQRAKDLNASHIVFEINTNGGVLTASLDIAKFIKALKQPTTAWINPKAYSAGILIGAACDKIIMAPSASAGDAAPINMFGEDMAPTERAKVLSPLLNEMEDNARGKKYPYVFLHAMCVLGVEIYHVKHTTTGEEKYVNQIDKQIMVDGAKRSSLKDSVKDALGLGGDSDLVGTPSQEVATDLDREKWELIEQVHDGKTLLTLHQAEAEALGIAEPGTFSTDEEVLAYTQAAEVIRIDESWSEGLAGWLTSFPVRAFLLVVFVIAMVVEFITPGFGLGGAVAGIALLILILAPFVVGLAEIWHLILIFVGFMLLISEFFFIPGFGVLGIAGIVCMLAGFVLAVVPTSGNGPMPLPAPEMMGMLQSSLLWTFLAIIAVGVGMYFLTKHYGSLPLFNKLTLNASQTAVVAGIPGQTQRLEDPEVMEARKHIAGDEVLGGASSDGSNATALGAIGVTTMELRPIGRAEFAGKVIDVESVSTWIDRGRKVRVIEKVGNRIIVEAV